MEKLTKEQIDARLAKLRESRLNDETYIVVRPAMAMCYRMDLPLRITQIRQCAICGKDFEVSWFRGDVFSLETAEDIASEFRSAGMDAQFCCHCPDCVQKHGAAPYEMHIKAKDEQEWHVSLPEVYMYRSKEDDRYTSRFEYELVHRFLTFPEEVNDLAKFFDRLYNWEFREQELAFFVGQECIDRQPVPQETHDWEKRHVQERVVLQNAKLFFSGKPPIDFYAEQNLTVPRALSLIKQHIGVGEDGGKESNVFHSFMSFFFYRHKVLSYKGLNGADSVHDYSDAGFLKTKIDRALFKVLGITVVYDLEEMRRNMDLIWTENGYRGLLPLAYKALEETGKTQFTVIDYCKFMDDIRERILQPSKDTLDEASSMIESEITHDETLVAEMLDSIQQWMAKQAECKIASDKVKEYLYGELFPNIRFGFQTVEKVFRKKYEGYMPTYVYFDVALERFIAVSTIPIRGWWMIDAKYVEKQKEFLMSEKGGFLDPLYRRKGQEELSLQDIFAIQEEINAIFEKRTKCPHIEILSGTGKAQ